MSERKDYIEVLKQMLKQFEKQNTTVPTLSRIDALRFAINSLEVDEAYQLEYEKTKQFDVANYTLEHMTDNVKELMEGSYAKGFNDAMRKISLSGIHEQQYKRGRDSMIDELKEIREEIYDKADNIDTVTYDELSNILEQGRANGMCDAVAILDKRISELEGKNNDGKTKQG